MDSGSKEKKFYLVQGHMLVEDGGKYAKLKGDCCSREVSEDYETGNSKGLS